MTSKHEERIILASLTFALLCLPWLIRVLIIVVDLYFRYMKWVLR